MSTIPVTIKSAWSSKINWGALITLILTVLNFLGIVIPQEIQIEFQTAITAIYAIYAFIMRTFFTTFITASSASRVG